MMTETAAVMMTDTEAERLALGAAMLELEAAAKMFESLTAEDFQTPLHKATFRGLHELWEAGIPLEPHLIDKPLRERKDWPEDARAYVYTHLSSMIEESFAGGMPWYCGRLKQATAKRKLYQACTQAMQRLESEPDGLADTLEWLQGQLQTTSSPIETSLRRSLSCEISLADLQKKAQEEPDMSILPFLGDSSLPFFAEGLSHILAAAPKAGKTTLLIRLTREWAESGHRVLFVSEEPEIVWRRRMAAEESGEWLERIILVCCLGLPVERLLGRVKSGEESIVILDTSKILGVEDENDSSTVNLAITPWIATAREKSKTFIMAHHCRKGGGAQVDAVAGSHAWTGVFDTVLELLPDDRNDNQRQLRAVGRLLPSCKTVYSMANGLLTNLGSPGEVELQAVKERLLDSLTEEWETTSNARKRLGEPLPSASSVKRALEDLAAEGLLERDPPLSEGARQGKYYKWRRPTTSSPALLYREEEVEGSMTL
jgi:hypothetical protein